MVITFNKNTWEEKSFQVERISYEVDDSDCPIDIQIIGEKEILEQISEYASIGFNMQPLEFPNDKLPIFPDKDMYECLCAHLQPFVVTKHKTVTYNNY